MLSFSCHSSALHRFLLSTWCLLVLVGCQIFSSDSPQTALWVDGRPVMQSEIDALADQLMRQAREQWDADSAETMRLRIERQAREDLIMEAILANEIEREQIKVTPEDIEEEVDILRAYLVAYGSSLQSYMEETELDEATLREKIAGELAQQMLFDRLLKLDPPTTVQCQTYFNLNPERYASPEAVLAYHILVALPVDAPADRDERTQLRLRANMIRERVLAGEDFASLVREFSDDLATKEQEGRLGWLTKESQLPTSLLEAAFTLEPGQVAPVVQTISGYHVLVVTEHRARREPIFEEVEPIIREELKDRRRQAAVGPLLKRLREQATVTTHSPDKD